MKRLAHYPTDHDPRSAPLSIARFSRHYLEMVIVMLAAMGVIGAVSSAIFAVIGHASLYHYAGFRAFIMSVNMTIGMTVWMRLRGHAWRNTIEMAGAMMLPVALLIGPLMSGRIGAGIFLLGVHALMVPFMAIAMLIRYRDYASEGHHRSRLFARFNRRIANPVMRLMAGRRRPFAIVVHRGRRTGREYQTPACAFETEEGLVFAVLYGSESDWVRNVIAANGAMIQRQGRGLAYSHPRLLTRKEGMTLVPRPLGLVLRLLRVGAFLAVTKAAPGGSTEFRKEGIVTSDRDVRLSARVRS